MGHESPRRAILFANVHSGRGRRWLFPLISQLQRQGIDLACSHFDLRSAAIETALQEAKARGIHVVLASGGDGTIGSVLQHVAGTDFTLGVIPAGTSNDFARSLRIPMSVAGAVDVVARGMATRVDVGDVNGQLFGHAATMGLNTEFARRANQLRRLLGRASYPLACAQVYRDRVPFEMKLTTEGQINSFRAFEVAIVNAPVYGGPLELEVPEADLMDRRLAVVVVEDLTLGTILQALPHALRRRRLKLPGVPSFTITSAQMEALPPQDITVDGELRTQTPASIRVRPRALRVYVPSSFTSRHA